jgi:hypothetical protein
MRRLQSRGSIGRKLHREWSKTEVIVEREPGYTTGGGKRGYFRLAVRTNGGIRLVQGG